MHKGFTSNGKDKTSMEGKFDVPKFGTINECAKMTGLSKFHVRQLVLQNKVKYIQAGIKYLVNVDNLVDYLNKGDNVQQAEEINIYANERKVKNA